MWFRKSCFCRKTVRWNVSASYGVSGLTRKRSTHLLESLPRESAARQTAQGFGVRDLRLEDSPSPVGLRLQLGDRLGDRFGGDQASLEIGADRGVAVASAGERLRTT